MKTSTLILLSSLVVLPFTAWAQSDAEADFFGEDAVTVTTAPVNTADPTKQFSESSEGVRWGGTVDSSATWNGGWIKQWPSADTINSWNDGLNYSLATKLFVDGRPDKDFRFRLSLKTGYPFTTDTKNVGITSSSSSTTVQSTSTISVPNIKVWEMFTDVTVNDALFLRFGKQSASWGVSYFYSPGDVVSLTAKDASDPTAEREGPVAMKATVPFPGLKANLTGFVLARDSYFGTGLPTLKNLGYALQGDVLVGDAQLTLGGFYQADNAPKAVATINSGLGALGFPGSGDINVFSEAVFSYGSDVLKASGSATNSGYHVYAQTGNWDTTVYYTGTVGASYSNSDANLTLRTEYLYNPFGSSDADAAEKGLGTFYKQATTNTAGRSWGYGDAATPGIHYLTTLASLAKFGGSDKLSFSTLWQHNFSDSSGWVKPSFKFQPWDQLGFSWGVSVVYGDDSTQYPLTFQARDAKGIPLGAQRVTLNVGVTFGSGKY